MSLVEDIQTLPPERIEDIEKLTLRWVFQATLDFGMEAFEVFRDSPDEVKEVGEDVTREILDRLSGYNVPTRIYGTVDYKKARYVILPESMVRQALLVDSKAEKEGRSATIQMSQTSMTVRHKRGGEDVEVPGLLPPISTYGGKQYLTTTAFLHFLYHDAGKVHHLDEVTVFGVPNGLLQGQYNPSVNDSFWIAGRNAPTRGEDFRVRVSFRLLKAKAPWRVQKIRYDVRAGRCTGTWEG